MSAWPAVEAAATGAILVMIGDGDDLTRSRGQARASMRFVASTTHLQDWYAAASVVAQPSRWEAGAPLTVLEAMATGRSVVVSDVPGANEVVTAETGALVPAESSSALADALIARLRDPHLADAEGDAGANTVIGRLTLDRTNQRMADVYDEALVTRHHATR
jgi:glycosyltransferase involved in cell wall biosynthesis